MFIFFPGEMFQRIVWRKWLRLKHNISYRHLEMIPFFMSKLNSFSFWEVRHKCALSRSSPLPRIWNFTQTPWKPHLKLHYKLLESKQFLFYINFQCSWIGINFLGSYKWKRLSKPCISLHIYIVHVFSGTVYSRRLKFYRLFMKSLTVILHRIFVIHDPFYEGRNFC